MPLNLFYTMVQKSQKWPKTQIKGVGSCLNPFQGGLIIDAHCGWDIIETQHISIATTTKH